MESYHVTLYVILFSLLLLYFVKSGYVFWHYSRCVRPFVLLYIVVYYCLFLCLWLPCPWTWLSDILGILVSMCCCWLLSLAFMAWACLIIFSDWSYSWSVCSFAICEHYLCSLSPALFHDRDYWFRHVCVAHVGEPACFAPVACLGLLILPNSTSLYICFQ